MTTATLQPETLEAAAARDLRAHGGFWAVLCLLFVVLLLLGFAFPKPPPPSD